MKPKITSPAGQATLYKLLAGLSPHCFVAVPGPTANSFGKPASSVLDASNPCVTAASANSALLPSSIPSCAGDSGNTGDASGDPSGNDTAEAASIVGGVSSTPASTSTASSGEESPLVARPHPTARSARAVTAANDR